MVEIVEWVRQGKLTLPSDRILKSLTLFALTRLDFDPVNRNLAVEFEQEQTKRERTIQAEQEKAAKERRKRIDELAAHFLDLAGEAFEFEVLQTQQRLSVEALSFDWPLSPETKCPKAGKKVEWQEPLLSSLLRELAELVVSGHFKKNPSAVDVALFLSKHTGPYDKWVVTCGETRCTGITGTRCNEMLLRLVQKNQ